MYRYRTPDGAGSSRTENDLLHYCRKPDNVPCATIPKAFKEIASFSLPFGAKLSPNGYNGYNEG
jgi:hypothetical protein